MNCGQAEAAGTVNSDKTVFDQWFLSIGFDTADVIVAVRTLRKVLDIFFGMV